MVQNGDIARRLSASPVGKENGARPLGDQLVDQDYEEGGN